MQPVAVRQSCINHYTWHLSNTFKSAVIVHVNRVVINDTIVCVWQGRNHVLKDEGATSYPPFRSPLSPPIALPPSLPLLFHSPLSVISTDPLSFPLSSPSHPFLCPPIPSPFLKAPPVGPGGARPRNGFSYVLASKECRSCA